MPPPGYHVYAERFEDGDDAAPWVEEGSAHWAARVGDFERMRFLVEVEGVDLGQYDRRADRRAHAPAAATSPPPRAVAKSRVAPATRARAGGTRVPYTMPRS